ncbi:MAG: NADH-quinone oxidoreductase subunit NuoG [Thermoleophilaceae bacterium]
MARPEQKFVTFEIDGREVSAPDGAMLVDGAKYGDVEIPVFCYEPKLGQPVGACRMCLVEIEGIPKLQTACSTAVKDGMVVTTGSDRVKQAQNAVVEFLLINHPLDCPVCDKGGECPLQDITFGWGAGRSRFIEPKRHFRKPLELSPLVAIDRERCILCYRCVRFSQEISEDYQLVLLERGDHSFVGTHNGHPYVGPFTGNIIELCPVGALTSTTYRFRARPWDIEGSGSVCTLCPSQCNVEFTVRDDTRVLRVNARDNVEVDDGWLCDKGRFGYQIAASPERVTEPLVRDGGELRPVSWERALDEAQRALDRAGEATATLVGGEATNEEGYLLQFLMREVLGSPHIDSRRGGSIDPGHARMLARPDLSACVSDIDYAATVLVLETDLVEEAPILDLRVRKGTRRRELRLVVASSRPSSLDENAESVLRFAPGAGEAMLGALAAAVAGADVEDLARCAGADGEAVRTSAAALTAAGPLVILWGERIAHGDRGDQALAALLELVRVAGVEDVDGAGLIEIPAGTNGRGLREVGCVPNMKPGLVESDGQGSDAATIAGALGEELSALILFQADPMRTHPGRELWERALDRASAVIGFSDFLTESLAKHANVVFPAEAYTEKEGTVTHPDGRLQRVRQAVGRPGAVRPGWQVLLDLTSRLLGSPLALSGPALFGQIASAVPFYHGLTLDEIGGRGIRWQGRDAASRLPESPLEQAELEAPPELPAGLRLGTSRSLWAGRETDHAPSLRFLSPRQRVEISAADARDRGIAPGEEVEVAVEGASVSATAALRESLAPGSVFLIEGTSRDNATALMNGAPRTVELRKP